MKTRQTRDDRSSLFTRSTNTRRLLVLSRLTVRVLRKLDRMAGAPSPAPPRCPEGAERSRAIMIMTHERATSSLACFETKKSTSADETSKQSAPLGHSLTGRALDAAGPWSRLGGSPDVGASHPGAWPRTNQRRPPHPDSRQLCSWRRGRLGRTATRPEKAAVQRADANFRSRPATTRPSMMSGLVRRFRARRPTTIYY